MSEEWTTREYERFVIGTYTAPVWALEPWFRDAANHYGTDHRRLHYVHMSTDNRALLAYTQSAAKGERDIQTPIKPGRYLTQYFSGVLTPKQIAFYASWQATGKRDSAYDDETQYPLAFATDADDIVRVYSNGPASCMDGSHFRNANNPVRVYAAGDLAIAYLHEVDDADNVVARALVWPAKLVMGRMYPTPGCDGVDKDQQNALFERLRAAGYRTLAEGGSFDGARLLKEEGRRGFVMPYLDGDYHVDDGGEYWIMREDGEYGCQNVDGTLEAEKEPIAICDRCNDPIRDGDEANRVCTYASIRNGRVRAQEHEIWCDFCSEHHTFFCEGIEGTCVNDMRVTTIDGTDYCEAWAKENLVLSDYSEDWMDPDDSVRMENGDTWHRYEFHDHGFTCALTGENYPDDERHPDHPDVWRGVDVDDLADWLELHAARNNERQTSLAA